MSIFRFLRSSVAVAMIAVISTLGAAALTPSHAGSGVPTAGGSKPRVVIIRADWCSACQQLEPTMMQLMQEYAGKLDFIMLDVTTEESTAKAAATARSLGLSAFFESNKKMTSTVAVFKGKSAIFKTAKNFNRGDYVNAFEKALKRG